MIRDTRGRGISLLAAVIVSFLATLVAAPRSHAGGYPPGTLVVFYTDLGYRWIVRNGAVVDRGFGGIDSAMTAGLATTMEGKVLEAFSAYEEVPEGTHLFSGIDVLSPDGWPESRLIFENRCFSGIAIGENDDVWVSDGYTTLLQIDTATGDILRELPLGERAEFLQDIDSNGFFYLIASPSAESYRGSHPYPRRSVRSRYCARRSKPRRCSSLQRGTLAAGGAQESLYARP